MDFNLKSFGVKCLRVWRVLRKPSGTEYRTIAKVTAIGALILGVMGFIISVAVRSLQG
jgi:protein transport protein SEC61 subunit gamma-like protein